jgi:MOSC domain-containing protein YiiM
VSGLVVGVQSDSGHRFSKPGVAEIRLVAGVGVDGDAHAGPTVQHRSRVRRDPSQPNLRQVHLIHGELHDELAARGFDVGAGDMGENVTTSGVDLLALPTGTVLRLGRQAEVELTGLRNPCVQLDRFADGLLAAVLDRDADGELLRKAGVMAIVRAGGSVRVGDPIAVQLPQRPHRPLRPV